jgi:hypothetical protein
MAKWSTAVLGDGLAKKLGPNDLWDVADDLMLLSAHGYSGEMR